MNVSRQVRASDLGVNNYVIYVQPEEWASLSGEVQAIRDFPGGSEALPTLARLAEAIMPYDATQAPTEVMQVPFGTMPYPT